MTDDQRPYIVFTASAGVLETLRRWQWPVIGVVGAAVTMSVVTSELCWWNAHDLIAEEDCSTERQREYRKLMFAIDTASSMEHSRTIGPGQNEPDHTYLGPDFHPDPFVFEDDVEMFD